MTLPGTLFDALPQRVLDLLLDSEEDTVVTDGGSVSEGTIIGVQVVRWVQNPHGHVTGTDADANIRSQVVSATLRHLENNTKIDVSGGASGDAAVVLSMPLQPGAWTFNLTNATAQNHVCGVAGATEQLACPDSHSNASLTHKCKASGEVVSYVCPAPLVLPSCQFWVPSASVSVAVDALSQRDDDIEQTWSTLGCTVVASSPGSVQCSCTHMTDFGTAFVNVGDRTRLVSAFQPSLPLPRSTFSLTFVVCVQVVSTGGNNVSARDVVENLPLVLSIAGLLLLSGIMIICAFHFDHQEAAAAAAAAAAAGKRNKQSPEAIAAATRAAAKAAVVEALVSGGKRNGQGGAGWGAGAGAGAERRHTGRTPLSKEGRGGKRGSLSKHPHHHATHHHHHEHSALDIRDVDFAKLMHSSRMTPRFQKQSKRKHKHKHKQRVVKVASPPHGAAVDEDGVPRPGSKLWTSLGRRVDLSEEVEEGALSPPAKRSSPLKVVGPAGASTEEEEEEPQPGCCSRYSKLLWFLMKVRHPWMAILSRRGPLSRVEVQHACVVSVRVFGVVAHWACRASTAASGAADSCNIPGAVSAGAAV